MAKTAMKISGVGRLRKVFEDRRRKAGSASVSVGYTKNYAIYVHEMIPASPQWGRPREGKDAKGAYWDPASVGQPKFLEQPARELQNELAKIIEKVVSNGGSLMDGLWIAGLRLQAASQKLVPVDTGDLKGSAFTRRD